MAGMSDAELRYLAIVHALCVVVAEMVAKDDPSLPNALALAMDAARVVGAERARDAVETGR